MSLFIFEVMSDNTTPEIRLSNRYQLIKFALLLLAELYSYTPSRSILVENDSIKLLEKFISRGILYALRVKKKCSYETGTDTIDFSRNTPRNFPRDFFQNSFLDVSRN